MPNNFSSVQPFLAFGGKIDPLSEIRNAGIVTSGRVIWVKDTADSDYTTVGDAVGYSNLRTTIQAGVDLTRSDKNDYVLVVPRDGGSVYAPNGTAGTALFLNKARMHLMSVGYGQALHGYSNTIQGFGTTTAVDTSLVKVLAPGVEMAGFRILGTNGTSGNGTTTAHVLLGTAASGTAHNFYLHDSVIESNLASGAGANGTPLLVNTIDDTGPDGIRFDNVSLINVAGPYTALHLNNIGARHEFYNVKLVMNAAATADKFVTNGTGNTRYALFKNCDFINTNSAAKPASAFTGSTTTTNPVLVEYSTSVNVTQIGTDPTIFKAPAFSGTQAAIFDPGIAIGTAAVTPA